MSLGREIVSDTGPLISLEKLHNGYAFMRELYETLIIPPVVLVEVAEGEFANPLAYLHHYGISDFVLVRAVTRPTRLLEAERLHVGELQAIQLALELQLPLLIEETIGRRVAQRSGLAISGIAGQIVAAFRKEIVSAAEANIKLDELLQAGRINRRIYAALRAHIYSA